MLIHIGTGQNNTHVAVNPKHVVSAVTDIALNCVLVTIDNGDRHLIQAEPNESLWLTERRILEAVQRVD